MSFLEAFGVSASALGAQRLRMNVISVNLANVETTKTPEGGPYRRKGVVFSAEPVSPGFERLLRAASGETLYSVSAKVVDDKDNAVKRVFDPNHPEADASGFVSKPNINIVEEMVELLSASRSYEANITAFNASKDMALKALEIGA
ncbi:MAG: flagellar basal body rod protein FlgC [Candidatus Tectomicrobia bacterium]|nr:flagellar basal body rod protein FlgC [Candidatus Tectomicrobia bacterium]